MYKGGSPLTTAQDITTDMGDALVIATTASKCVEIYSSFFD
jgi:hypothetical protein